MYLDKRLLRLVRKSRLFLALTIGLGFVGGVLAVMQASFLSRVISQVFLEQRSLPDVKVLLGILVGIFILRAITLYVGGISADTIALQVKQAIRERLYQHIIELGPNYLSGERTGELSNTLVEGIESLDAYFSQYFPQLILAALVPLTYLAFVFPLDTLSGFVLLITAPLIPVFMVLIGSVARTLTQKQWQGLSRMSAHFLDVLQGLTTLKIFGRSREQIKVIARISDRFRDTTMGVLRVAFLSALVLEMVATISTAVVAVEIGLRLLYGRLGFEQALFVLILAPEFYLPLRMLGTRFHAGISGVAAAQRIFEVLEEKTSIDQMKSRGEPLTGSRGSRLADLNFYQETIRFENVHYSYRDGRQALKGISLHLPPGGQVAVVGPTGAGKSTLIHMLLRFMDPTQGQISVGDMPLADIDVHQLRANIAWVPQNPYLFNDTVLANIRLARPDATMDDVIRAAKQAQAHEFIAALPHQYETLIGERGSHLSGGQAQRISLARAFLKDAPVLILDEPSANLDPELAVNLHEVINSLKTGRTVLIIAHRMLTVMRADKIVVLQSGELIQTGTHANLLQVGGLYQRMVNAYSAADFQFDPPIDRSDFLPESSTGYDPETKSDNQIPEYFAGISAEHIGPQPDPSLLKTDSSMGAASKPLRPLWRMLRLIAPYSAQITLAVLLGFVTIGSSIGLMGASAYIISAAALRPSIAELQVAIVGVRFFGIARGVFRYLERYVSHQVTLGILSRLRVWFYEKLEPLAPARIMSYRSGDLLARVITDIESLENFYVRGLAPPLVAVGVLFLSYGLLFPYHPSLAIGLFLMLSLSGVVLPWFVHQVSVEPGREVVAARTELNVTLVDGIQGLGDLLIFAGGDRQLERVRRLSEKLGIAQKRFTKIKAFQTALGNLLTNLGMWVVLVIAIPLVDSGSFDGVYLAVVVLIALSSFEAVIPLPLAAQELEGNLEAARRIFQLVDTEPAVMDPAVPQKLPDESVLEVENLSFCYPPIAALDGSGYIDPEIDFSYANVPGVQDQALHQITFKLGPGSRLAIVGPSGAGKTTLVNLLLRFWDYRDGLINLGGSDLRSYAQEELRERIAVVSQGTHLFNASIRENLLIARHSATDAQIEHAAKRAQIHEFIQSLPQGYRTWIGEQGYRLSGGERQRLAIARALLKDAPILILDEPTANLDTITERDVLQAIHHLMEDRATLMVTHRLVGMEWMDEIIVLRRGCTVERGTHQELLERSGVYRKMWNLQNQILAMPD